MTNRTVADLVDTFIDADTCANCGIQVAFTEDWTLYPWPDGTWLCRRCNEKRFITDDWEKVEEATGDVASSHS